MSWVVFINDTLKDFECAVSVYGWRDHDVDLWLGLKSLEGLEHGNIVLLVFSGVMIVFLCVIGT